jgi:hypothetical protein
MIRTFGGIEPKQHSRPLVKALHDWLIEQVQRVSGRSPLVQAMRYALNHWNGLILHLDDGGWRSTPTPSDAPCARWHSGGSWYDIAPFLKGIFGR